MFLPGAKPGPPQLPPMGGPAVQGAAWPPQATASPPPRRGYGERTLSGSPSCFTPSGTMHGPLGSPMGLAGSPMSFQMPNCPVPQGLSGRTTTPVDGLALYDQDGLPRMGSSSPGGLCPQNSMGQPNSMARPLVLSPGGLNHHHHHHHGKVNSAPGGCDRAEDGCDPTKEEECNADDCGDEMRGPQEEHKATCGLDVRPLLPVLLVGSTILGAAGGLALWLPMLRSALGQPYSGIVRWFFLALYTVTCCCMAYCAFSDPGQVAPDDPCVAHLASKDEEKKPLEDGEEEDEEEGPPMPRRAHKAWQYPRPIRRYDHYCRWLANCIGLLNHREFVIMCSGLVTLGVLGSLLNITLLVVTSHNGETPYAISIGLALHLIYSIILALRVWPILQLHIGFISRNELANEWKRNDFYVITSARTGKVVPVNDLSDDEHNERFDSFHYASEKNSYDKGIYANCLSFWFTPRWRVQETGEF